jgi:hypothetical protein
MGWRGERKKINTQGFPSPVDIYLWAGGLEMVLKKYRGDTIKYLYIVKQ